MSIKKAADLAAFFNEEERRGVKRTRFFALDYHIGCGDKYFRFFLWSAVFDGLIKSHISDGFVKSSRSRLANLEE